MSDLHKNFAYSTVSTAPVTPTAGTSLTVALGGGALLPTPPFNATVWPSGVQPLASNAEIIRVTLIVGDVLTIVRAQEGSTARTIIATDQISATITAKTLTDAENSTGMHRELGTNRTAPAIVATTSFVTYATVTATSKGGKCKVPVDWVMHNAGSGASRSYNMQVTCDGTPITGTFASMTNIYASAEYPTQSYHWVADSTPAAGSHTWNFQLQANTASSIGVDLVYMEVIEVLP